MALALSSFPGGVASGAGNHAADMAPGENDFAWVVQYRTTGAISAMTALSPTRAWVASGTEIYLFKGSNWRRQFTVAGTSTKVTSLSAFDPTHAWATGTAASGASTNVYFFNGAAWGKPKQLPLEAGGIAALGRGRALVAGRMADGSGQSQGVVFYFNGTTWAKQLAAPEALTAISAADADKAWAVGKAGGIYFFNGKTWIHQFDTHCELTCVSATGGSQAMAGGVTGRGGKTDNVVYAFDGAKWSKAGDLGGLVEVEAASDGSAGAQPRITSVATVDSHHSWAACEGLYSYNGTFWMIQVNTPREFRPTSVASADQYDVWAGDSQGTIYTRVNVSGIRWLFPSEILR